MKRPRQEILYENDEIQIIKVFKKRKLEETRENAEPIEIYTDGACSNNGRDEAKAGIGVYYVTDKIQDISERLPGKNQTNNRAELYAIIRALEELDRYLRNDLEVYLEHHVEVIVYSDSKYCVNIINEGWNRKKNTDLWEQLDKIHACYKNLKFQYVRGHSGIEGNEIADKLATDSIK